MSKIITDNLNTALEKSAELLKEETEKLTSCTDKEQLERLYRRIHSLSGIVALAQRHFGAEETTFCNSIKLNLDTSLENCSKLLADEVGGLTLGAPIEELAVFDKFIQLMDSIATIKTRLHTIEKGEPFYA